MSKYRDRIWCRVLVYVLAFTVLVYAGQVLFVLLGRTVEEREVTDRISSFTVTVRTNRGMGTLEDYTPFLGQFLMVALFYYEIEVQGNVVTSMSLDTPDDLDLKSIEFIVEGTRQHGRLVLFDREGGDELASWPLIDGEPFLLKLRQDN